MIDPDFVQVVCLPDPDEALTKLDEAYTTFANLLDYVASVHPQMLNPDFALDVEMMVNHVWVKYDLPQS